jgi:hypothetical protein
MPLPSSAILGAIPVSAYKDVLFLSCVLVRLLTFSPFVRLVPLLGKSCYYHLVCRSPHIRIFAVSIAYTDCCMPSPQHRYLPLSRSHPDCSIFRYDIPVLPVKPVSNATASGCQVNKKTVTKVFFVSGRRPFFLLPVLV